MRLTKTQNGTKTRALSSETHQQLVAFLFDNQFPVVVLTLALNLVAIVAAVEHGGPFLTALAVAAAVVGAARIVLISVYHRHPERRDVRSWERLYAAGSFLFALIVSLTSALILMAPDRSLHLMAVGLLYAYAAGITARLSVRPWICNPCLLIAAVPPTLALMLQGEADYFALAALTLIMLVAALETVSHIHVHIVRSIESHQHLAELAQSDQLTRLPNRLMLETHLKLAMEERPDGTLLAVHFLDLDRFKEANDRFGHSVGDAVLRTVAARLRGLVRESDLVARFGGDEFVIVQCGLKQVEEAGLLAIRVVKSLGEPIAIDGRTVAIGATVGVAIAPLHAEKPCVLVEKADAALYAAKRRRRGSIAFADEEVAPVAAA